MDYINLLGSSGWPDGFWPTLIKLFDFIGSYALIIIVFTICLKLVLSPLDFLQRYYTNKTTREQAKLAPQLEKLKRQYGNNQNLLYQKQNELYQKNGVSNRGSCIFMLVYLALTLVIFITLFQSMQYIASFKIKNQYTEMQTTYYTEYNEEYIHSYLGVDIEGNELKVYTDEELQDAIAAKIADLKTQDASLTDDQAQAIIDEKQNEISSTSQDLVVEKYEEVKDSFLWINNIWVADKPTQKAVLSYDSYIASTQHKEVTKEEYNAVMGKLLQEDSKYNVANGYYILSLIVIAVSLLSQYITRKTSQPKGKNGEQIATPGAGKVMMLLMPAIMVMFTLNSSSIFSIYIITNSLMSTLLVPVIMKICNSIEEKNEQRQYQKTKVDYRR